MNESELQAGADHALDVFEAEVELHGGEVEQAILLAHTTGTDETGIVASHGPDSPEDVFRFLLTATIGVGGALGFDVRVFGGGQG